MAPPTPEEINKELIAALGEEAVAAEEAAREMRKFNSSIKSMADKQKKFGESLIASGIPLVKFAGTITKTLSSYNASIQLAQKQQETNQRKLAALEKQRDKDFIKVQEARLQVSLARTKQERDSAKRQLLTEASRLQSTLTQIETTKLNTEEQKKIVNRMKSEKFDEVIKQTAKSMKETAVAFDKLSVGTEKVLNNIRQTQQNFGLSMTQAVKLQAATMMDTVKGFVNMFQSIDLRQIFDGIEEIAGSLFDNVKSMGSDLLDRKLNIRESTKKIVDDLYNILTKERPGKSPTAAIEAYFKQRMEAIKSVQTEFGIISNKLGNQLANQAARYGLNIDQLTTSLRTFSTITGGSLSKAEKIQTRFFDVFSARGMTPKVALEAIIKYAELIARNGARFADSFARAAADAKKIGIDLGKVDQVGDSIIDNFEGFLEGQASLGAMGFNFDPSRLASAAVTGNTGLLLNELRSQLAGMGKDIMQLTRPERLELESAFGINISELQRLAGKKPEISPELSAQQEGNNLLSQILGLLIIAGPVFKIMSIGIETMADGINSLASLIGLGGAGLLVSLATGSILALVTTYLSYKTNQSKMETIKTLYDRAKQRFLSGDEDKAKEDLRTAIELESEIARFTLGTAFGESEAGAFELNRQEFDKRLKELEAQKIEKIKKDIEEQRRTGRSLRSSFTPPVTPQPTSPPSWWFGGFQQQPILPSQPQVGPRITTPQAQERGRPPGMADGGLVRGPGTPTSDSIPARLSNGEYVLNADATRAVGVNNLDKLNNSKSYWQGVSDYTNSVLDGVKSSFLTPLKYFNDGILKPMQATIAPGALPSSLTEVWRTNLLKIKGFMGSGQFAPEFIKKLKKLFGAINPNYAIETVDKDVKNLVKKIPQLDTLGPSVKAFQSGLTFLDSYLLYGRAIAKTAKGDVTGAGAVVGEAIFSKALQTYFGGTSLTMGGAGSSASLAALSEFLLPLLIITGIKETYNTYQTQKEMPWNKGKNPLLWTTYDRAGGDLPQWVKNSRERERNKPRRRSWLEGPEQPRKYHDGGIVKASGSKTEVPAILQAGELVLTRQQTTRLSETMRNLGVFAENIGRPNLLANIDKSIQEGLGNLGKNVQTSITTAEKKSGFKEKITGGLKSIGNLFSKPGADGGPSMLNQLLQGSGLGDLLNYKDQAGGFLEQQQASLPDTINTLIGSVTGLGAPAGQGKESLFSRGMSWAKGLFSKKPTEGASVASEATAGVASAVGVPKEEVQKTFMSRMSGKLSKIPGVSKLAKIPGIGKIATGTKFLGKGLKFLDSSGALGGMISGFQTGGIKGAIAGGAGSAIGTALGTLIPIPGVGSLLGGLAGQKIGEFLQSDTAKKIGRGIKTVGRNVVDAPMKLLGGLTGKIFGKKAGAAVGKLAPTSLIKSGFKGIKKLFGKGKKGSSVAAEAALPGGTPEILTGGPESEMINSEQIPSFMPEVMSSMNFGGGGGVGGNIQIPPIDTRGIEEKMSQFITSLNNMNIVMDGSKVGKVLVNSTDAATTVGMFRPGSQATY